MTMLIGLFVGDQGISNLQCTNTLYNLKKKKKTGERKERKGKENIMTDLWFPINP